MAVYIAARRGFAYPTGEGLALARRAGGLAQVAPADRAKVRYKVVPKGGDCSDMPKESLAVYLERGDVIQANAPQITEE